MTLIIDSLDEDASLLLESPLMTPHQGEHGLLGLGVRSISGPCWKHLFIHLPLNTRVVKDFEATAVNRPINRDMTNAADVS